MAPAADVIWNRYRLRDVAVPVIAFYGDAIGIRAFSKRENLDDDLTDRAFHELTSLIDTPES